VLLLEHTPQGALGLMINRPTEISLHEALPATRQWIERGDRLFLGGPVETQLIAFLMRAETQPPHSKRVFANVYASGDSEALIAALEESIGPNHFRAYLGYSGWGPGQLDAEIARGDWHLSPAHPDLVFSPPQETLWDDLVFEYEGTQVDRGHPLDQLKASRPGESEPIRLAAMVPGNPDGPETNGD
ncbi:YqgE/AlgH family protein, partial [Myxococcota bacterium]|nr:YqgE/AlgH family protein [Myxococcota bacterium]